MYHAFRIFKSNLEEEPICPKESSPWFLGVKGVSSVASNVDSLSILEAFVRGHPWIDRTDQHVSLAHRFAMQAKVPTSRNKEVAAVSGRACLRVD